MAYDHSRRRCGASPGPRARRRLLPLPEDPQHVEFAVGDRRGSLGHGPRLAWPTVGVRDPLGTASRARSRVDRGPGLTYPKTTVVTSSTPQSDICLEFRRIGPAGGRGVGSMGVVGEVPRGLRCPRCGAALEATGEPAPVGGLLLHCAHCDEFFRAHRRESRDDGPPDEEAVAVPRRPAEPRPVGGLSLRLRSAAIQAWREGLSDRRRRGGVGPASPLGGFVPVLRGWLRDEVEGWGGVVEAARRGPRRARHPRPRHRPRPGARPAGCARPSSRRSPPSRGGWA